MPGKLLPIRRNSSHQSVGAHDIIATKQNTTKPCVYIMGHTVCIGFLLSLSADVNEAHGQASTVVAIILVSCLVYI